jgi:hypothetical protein
MSNDPQNKLQSRPDNIVSLSRHELVANIEQTLTTARRLFSLQEYLPCEELVLQVLSLDPHNAKAKALLELTSIKLSKRKLYRKIVEPRVSGELPKAHQPNEAKTEDATLISQNPVPGEITSDAQGGPIQKNESPGRRLSQKGSLPKSERLQDSGARKGDAPPPDTMRERTINALVDLLKDKGKPVEEWKGAHNPTQASSESSTENSPPALLSSTGTPSPLQRDKAGKTDFLSGSLTDLFESAQGKSDGLEVKPEVGHQNEAIRKSAGLKVQKSLPQPESNTATPPTAGHSGTVMEHVGLAQRDIAPRSKAETSPAPVTPHVGDTGSKDRIPTKVVQLPGVRFFDQILTPSKPDYKQLMEKKLEERSEEIKNSEIKTVSIAQIKKYLYQEQYELCSQELERIRVLFPKNAEIQAFVENTSKRLTELQRIKAFEDRAKDLMLSAVAFYQEGKLTEALIAVREVLRVNPDQRQAREFIDFVERRMSKEKKKEIHLYAVRYCQNCGTTVDSVSAFCFHCGKRL